MSVSVTILGCGASGGVPTIGNHWGACDPQEPKNYRTRPGVLVRSATTAIAVDTGADFRAQINRENVPVIDAVLYTHAHSDHVGGIDELRVWRVRHKKLVDIYATPDTLAELKVRFDYMFAEKSTIYPQVLTPHVITPQDYGRTMTIGDIDFIPFEQDHGTCKSLGFRFGDLAYSTDMVGLSDDSIAIIKGVKTWIVDAAGYKMEKNLVHMTLEQLYALNKRVQARQVYLTHMTPAMDYRTLLQELSDGYAPAYDGLILAAN